jgi:hypothetical protein
MLITHGPLILDKTWLRGRGGCRLYRVRHACEVRLNGAYLCEIHQGFLTDITSWPQLLRRLRWVPTVRRWLRDARRRYEFPAVLHDDLLANSEQPKWQVDAIYMAALRCEGVPALEAWIFGNAVRVKRGRR